MPNRRVNKMRERNQYKKVYVEITNRCNLACDFCIQNQREQKDMTISDFQLILEKLYPYTKYLYFHILGEPLLHPKIDELIDIASKNYFVNITTNGYLIDRIKYHQNIRQLNISLHSFDPKYFISLEKYLKHIFDCIDLFDGNQTYVSLRLWVKNSFYQEIINAINKRYHCEVNFKKNTFQIRPYLFVSQFHEFIWPDLNNHYYQENGTCYGLRDHFGILVDGTIIPCCLDTKGDISLGNIYQEELENILTSSRCKTMKQGFCQGKKVEELCRHCSFLE